MAHSTNTPRRRAIDVLLVLLIATVVAAVLVYLFFGGVLAVLWEAHSRGLPLGISTGDRGAVHIRGANVLRRVQFQRMPATDESLENWFREKPGVENLEIRRVDVSDPELVRLLKGSKAVEFEYRLRGSARELTPPWADLGYGGEDVVPPAKTAVIDHVDAAMNWLVFALVQACSFSIGIATVVLWRKRQRARVSVPTI